MRYSIVFASVVALAAAAPLDLPVVGDITKGLPLVGGDSQGLPVVDSLPVKRDILNAEVADLLDVDVASPSVPDVKTLPVKRDIADVKAAEDLVHANVASPKLPSVPAVGKLPVRDIADIEAADLVDADVSSLPETNFPIKRADLPIVGDLPLVGGLGKNLPVVGSLKRDLPIVGDLPLVGGLGKDLPVVGSLKRDLPIVGDLPLVGDITKDLPIDSLPVKREALDLPIVGDVLPTEVTHLTDGVTNTLPVKRDLINVNVAPEVVDTVEEVLKTLTDLVGDVTTSLEVQEKLSFVINTLTGLIQVTV